jgi:hypothetical protein
LGFGLNNSARAATAFCFLLGKSILNCFHASMRNATAKPSVRGWRFLTLLAVGIVAVYVLSVGIVAATLRHTGDGGRLQWLPSIPGAVTLLQAYEWPAQQLSRVRVLHSVFELSASFWWSLLAPPDTTA